MRLFTKQTPLPKGKHKWVVTSKSSHRTNWDYWCPVKNLTQSPQSFAKTMQDYNYWCPVNFWGRNRSVGPISHQPRATPWVDWLGGDSPWRGKSIKLQCVISAFAPSGRNLRLTPHPGRCPGLMALSPFRGIIQAVGLIPFKLLYIHRVRGVYRIAINP